MNEEKSWNRDGLEFQYVIKGKGAVLTSFTGNAAVITLPEKVENVNLVGIGKKAFLSNKILLELTLPGTIEFIEEWAFACCDRLKKIALPNRELSVGKSIFQQCNQLERIAFPESGKEEDAEYLLAAVNRLRTPYLFNLETAGKPEWLNSWDQALSAFMERSDREGYSKTLLCGEEDYGSLENNLDYYQEQKRKEKVRLILLRLLHPVGLSKEKKEILTIYLKEHTKCKQTEETWKVIKEEHGDDSRYFDLLLAEGCINEHNFDAVINDLESDQAEMKAYLLKNKESRLGKKDIFEDLLLEW